MPSLRDQTASRTDRRLPNQANSIKSIIVRNPNQMKYLENIPVNSERRYSKLRIHDGKGKTFVNKRECRLFPAVSMWLLTSLFLLLSSPQILGENRFGIASFRTPRLCTVRWSASQCAPPVSGIRVSRSQWWMPGNSLRSEEDGLSVHLCFWTVRSSGRFLHSQQIIWRKAPPLAVGLGFGKLESTRVMWIAWPGVRTFGQSRDRY